MTLMDTYVHVNIIQLQNVEMNYLHEHKYEQLVVIDEKHLFKTGHVSEQTLYVIHIVQFLLQISEIQVDVKIIHYVM